MKPLKKNLHHFKAVVDAEVDVDVEAEAADVAMVGAATEVAATKPVLAVDAEADVDAID